MQTCRNFCVTVKIDIPELLVWQHAPPAIPPCANIERNVSYDFLGIFSFDLCIMKMQRNILYTIKEAHIMIVTATEFKTNLGKYLEMAMKQDIFITKNGRNIARLTSLP